MLLGEGKQSFKSLNEAMPPFMIVTFHVWSHTIMKQQRHKEKIESQEESFTNFFF